MPDERKDPPDLPSVSIVMAVRNEAAFIARSLGSLLRQDYPVGLLEILVVDGESEDGTRSRVEHLAASGGGHRVRILTNPKRIFATGFNVGCREASGDVIVMMGGHTELAQDYVSRCVSHLLGEPAECVGGYMETVAPDAESRAIALALSSPFGVGGVGFRTRPDRKMWVDTVAFGAYWRSAFVRCGLLDENLVRNQDDEFNYRLRENGGRILLAPDVRSKYYSRAAMRNLWSQYRQYGTWKVRVAQLHPRQMCWRHFVPAAFVASVLGSALAGLFWVQALWATTGILAAYAGANLAATALSARRVGGVGAAHLPLAFLLVHASYGAGFLWGLARFWDGWWIPMTPPALEEGHRER